MSTQFFTPAMVDEQLNFPVGTFSRKILNRPIPPAARIGRVGVYSQPQVDWLRKREDESRGMRQTLPFIWRTPWDGKDQTIIFMTIPDITSALGLYETRLKRMLSKAPLEPDAVAGRYQGFLPTHVAQWLGANYKLLLTPEILGALNKFPQQQ